MENHVSHPAADGGTMQGNACTCWLCNGKCPCWHHKAVPVLAILFGLEFLLAQVNVLTWDFVNVTWPILVMLAGCVKLAGRCCKCCSGRE